MRNFITLAGILSITSFAALALPKLIIVNHTANPIGFHVQSDQHHTLPRSQHAGTINPQNQTQMTVKYNWNTCRATHGETNPSAYIRVGWVKHGIQDISDFFGVGRGCKQAGQNKRDVYTYGYLSKNGLAYSMYNAQADHNARIVFCTTASYIKHGGQCV